MTASPALSLHCWRHPRPLGAEGLCLGRTDLPVDPRRARRLAQRMRALARRERLPAVVWTSPLERCRAVGRVLRAAGWVHRVDARLVELDFGTWDGLAWSSVPRAAIDAWLADFLHHRPGGGESLAELLARVRAVLEERPRALLVTHGGWLSAAQWLRSSASAASGSPGSPGASSAPSPPGASAAPTPSGAPDPAHWPPAPAWGRLLRL
ncbi:MAG: histidine phosphatase family protein [Burkholderiales bacterium]|nr:histidine phosphatase family protein [Burkholderiales bacterium]OJX07450.1 MAG: hypothetical protein BGO72_08310 [Burkholderiales bacterium 70-64]